MYVNKFYICICIYVYQYVLSRILVPVGKPKPEYLSIHIYTYMYIYTDIVGSRRKIQQGHRPLNLALTDEGMLHMICQIFAVFA